MAHMPEKKFPKKIPKKKSQKNSKIEVISK